MSYSFLFGVPGKLKKLLNRLTETRANYLDNLPRLNVDVSSRADGSYYTAARAAKLDNLDTTVSSRLASNDAKIVRLDYTNQATLILTPVTDCLGSNYPPTHHVGGYLISPPPINTSLIYTASEVDITPNSTGSWVTTFSYTGSGYLLALAIQAKGASSDSARVGFKILIDGVTVFNSGNNTFYISDNYTKEHFIIFPIICGIEIGSIGTILAGRDMVFEIGSSLSIQTYKELSGPSLYTNLIIKKKAF